MHAVHCANDDRNGGDDNDFKKMIVKIKMENCVGFDEIDDENENPKSKSLARATDACRRTGRHSVDNCSDHFNRIASTRPALRFPLCCEPPLP